MSLIDFAYFLCLKNHIAEHHQTTISSKTDLRKLVIRLERTLHNRYINRRHLTNHLKETRSPTHQTEQTNLTNQTAKLTYLALQTRVIMLELWTIFHSTYFDHKPLTRTIVLYDWQLCDTKTKSWLKTYQFNSAFFFGMNCI